MVGAALAGSVAFFLVSNFAVWAAWTRSIPKTFAGLMMSYAAGLPFFRRAVEGDLLFTAAMFSAPVILHSLVRLVSQIRTITSLPHKPLFGTAALAVPSRRAPLRNHGGDCDLWTQRFRHDCDTNLQSI